MNESLKFTVVVDWDGIVFIFCQCMNEEADNVLSSMLCQWRLYTFLSHFTRPMGIFTQIRSKAMHTDDEISDSLFILRIINRSIPCFSNWFDSLCCVWGREREVGWGVWDRQTYLFGTINSERWGLQTIFLTLKWHHSNPMPCMFQIHRNWF